MHSSIVPKFQAGERGREPWNAARVWLVIDQHPDPYRPIPIIAAGLGLRQGCVFGLAEEDFDFDAMTVRIRRQVTRDSGQWTFKLPKGDKERTVPVSRGVAQAIRAHMQAYLPEPYTLPWEDKNGRVHGSRTVNLVFRWHGDDPRSSGSTSPHHRSTWGYGSRRCRGPGSSRHPSGPRTGRCATAPAVTTACTPCGTPFQAGERLRRQGQRMSWPE